MIAKFDVLEPRGCEDIKEILAPDICPKSFGTFEKQVLELNWYAQFRDKEENN